LRNTFRLTSRKYWDEIKREAKPIYTAVNATAARSAFDELAQKWGQRYPAVIRPWGDAWNEFIKAHRHFTSEQAALKCLYLVTRSLDPTGVGRARWTMRRKPALKAFAITFAYEQSPLTPSARNQRC
jgi:putative transposase